MDPEKIDPELLISLVECRPPLWDKSLSSHRDYLLRSSAWKDISKILNSNFNKLSRKEKHTYIRMIMKKWTNIRDAWKKCFTDRKRKPYIYNQQLKFMEKNFTFSKISTDDDACTNERADDSDTATESETSSHYKKRKVDERRGRECIEDDNKTNIKIVDVKSIEEESPHVMFMRGLIPSLRKLNDDEVLDFQMGVIKLLRDIRSSSSSEDRAVPRSSDVPSSSRGDVKIEP